ncbi:hypothetical protein BC941DRAFT_437015 [Chlamydoabsidia padenii]|nr:hypothetical protein BC941DRAFT_437015 [Chlamydoabsidia padenii]
MDYYEADIEEGFDDIEETHTTGPRPFQLGQQQQQQQQRPHIQLSTVTNSNYTNDDLTMDEQSVGDDSDYSLDYEYLGPRHPVYRDQNDADSDASELSCNLYSDTNPTSSTSAPTETNDDMEEFSGFDMWDEDPYSTNDFTWESNDMRLTRFIKAKQQDLLKTNILAPWQTNSSFWRKGKGWPRQLPYSSTTTNHDQSANALCLVPSNYAVDEQLYGIYRDRIVKCGRCWSSSLHPTTQQQPMTKLSTNNDAHKTKATTTTTWIDSDIQNSSSAGSRSLDYPPGGGNSSSNNSGISDSSSDGSKFCSTHISISLKRTSSSSIGLHSTTRLSITGEDDSDPATATITNKRSSLINKFIPYTKYIKRTEFTPPTGQQHAYIGLGFEPLCLERKYGFMAIGGLEGEFELYCCMDSDNPTKIWGTKFKGRDNIMLMTNAIQIVRWKRTNDDDDGDDDDNDDTTTKDGYDYFLFACMNEAGILVYKLPPHHQCITKQQQQQPSAQLYAHLQSFDLVPINDAKISPDGTKMVCVGDDGFVFLVNITHHPTSTTSSHDSNDMAVDDCVLSFGTPVKLPIPISLLQSMDPTASSTSTASTASPTTASSSSTPSPSSSNVQSTSTQMEVDGHAHHFDNTSNVTDDLSNSTVPYSSQHVVWNHSSEYFAHTSDTHHRVLVWRASTLDILCSIDAAGYTYAIKFHPYLDGVLAFSNRYGYFHTVDINQTYDRTTFTTSSTNTNNSILDFDQQTAEARGHTCNPYCIEQINIPASVPTSSSISTTTAASWDHYHHHSAHHTNHLKVRHEMTMVAFRGEKDRRLRILAKINGIQWSQDGCYLYVATKKRVLAYEFVFWSQQHVQSLFGLAGQKIRQLLEKQQQQTHQRNHQERKRKKAGLTRSERKKRQGQDQDGTTSLDQQKWHQKWSNLPQHVRHQVLKEKHLSSHW